jgi:hypothetical protein
MTEQERIDNANEKLAQRKEEWEREKKVRAAEANNRAQEEAQSKEDKSYMDNLQVGLNEMRAPQAMTDVRITPEPSQVPLGGGAGGGMEGKLDRMIELLAKIEEKIGPGKFGA